MDQTLERLETELRNAVADLSTEQIQHARSPDSWTIQQVVEHLLLSYAKTQEVADVRIAKGTPTKARPSLVQRLGQFSIVRLGVFPHGRRAPASVDPTNTPSRPLSGAELAGRIGNALSAMDHALAVAESIFGPSRRALSHLVLGPMDVTQWRKFHLVHGKHHIKQIAAIRNAIFP